MATVSVDTRSGSGTCAHRRLTGAPHKSVSTVTHKRLIGVSGVHACPSIEARLRQAGILEEEEEVLSSGEHKH